MNVKTNKLFINKKIEQKWCMCTELKGVLRYGNSTCSICGGKDAYGGSPLRPTDKKKKIRNKVEIKK
jgi:hypothetical protein